MKSYEVCQNSHKTSSHRSPSPSPPKLAPTLPPTLSFSPPPHYQIPQTPSHDQLPRDFLGPAEGPQGPRYRLPRQQKGADCTLPRELRRSTAPWWLHLYGAADRGPCGNGAAFTCAAYTWAGDNRAPHDYGGRDGRAWRGRFSSGARVHGRSDIGGACLVCYGGYLGAPYPHWGCSADCHGASRRGACARGAQPSCRRAGVGTRWQCRGWRHPVGHSPWRWPAGWP